MPDGSVKRDGHGCSEGPPGPPSYPYHFRPGEVVFISAKEPSPKELLVRLAQAACRYRNVQRGWRAEDKTQELPDVSDEEIDKYCAELMIYLFRLCDDYEEALTKRRVVR